MIVLTGNCSHCGAHSVYTEQGWECRDCFCSAVDSDGCAVENVRLDERQHDEGERV